MSFVWYVVVDGVVVLISSEEDDELVGVDEIPVRLRPFVALGGTVERLAVHDADLAIRLIERRRV